MTNKDLYITLIEVGERLPKKHGKWYRLNVYDDHWLILDTWNGYIYHYPNGAEPTGTDNMYNCVYTFTDKEGSPHNYKRVKENMYNFWYTHIYHLKYETRKNSV